MSDIAALVSDLIEARAPSKTVGRIVEALINRRPVAVRDEQAERRRAADRERKKLTDEMKQVIRARDGEVCVYCGEAAGPFHFDHIIPVSRGGRTVIENLAISCKTCNLEKGASTPEEWMLRI